MWRRTDRTAGGSESESYGRITVPAYADSNDLGPDHSGEGLVHVSWHRGRAEWVHPVELVTLPDPPQGTCADCLGTLLFLDVDGSITGDPGAPVPCPCSGVECCDWDQDVWDQFRAQMDAVAAVWVEAYGVPIVRAAAELRRDFEAERARGGGVRW